MSIAGLTEKTFDVEAGEWPIERVTVYNDQAEVCRKVVFSPETSGPVLVKLMGLPETISYDSVRAEVESHNARLLEVSSENTWVSGATDEKITERLRELQYLKQKAEKRVQRVAIRADTISRHQECVFKALSENTVDSNQTSLDPSVFGRVTEAGEFYEKLKKKVKTETFEANQQLAEIDREIILLNDKQNKLAQGKYVPAAKVLLEIPEVVLKKKNPQVVIELFYVVSGAKWKAKYDIRVEKGKDIAFLTYYGEVLNNTKENWVEVDVSLSTAKPSVGGALPKFPRLMLDLAKPEPVVVYNNYDENEGMTMDDFRMERAISMAAPPQMMSQMAPGGFFGGVGGGGLFASRPPPAPIVQAPAFQFEQAPETSVATGGDAGSTQFKLQRLVSIDSDNKPHKQTISRLELQSVFTHAASPKVSPSVFLKCSTVNQSNYPLLAGVMDVFIDGSFSSKSKMDLVMPRQDFALYLGIDDTIKLTFGPENIKDKTVGGGLMGGSKRTIRTYSRDIGVANNGPTEINCCIYAQVPLSKTGKIKVILKEPDINKPTGGDQYLMNSFNNLETRTKIPPGKKYEMKVKYTIEWPEGEILEMQEKNK